MNREVQKDDWADPVTMERWKKDQKFEINYIFGCKKERKIILYDINDIIKTRKKL